MCTYVRDCMHSHMHTDTTCTHGLKANKCILQATSLTETNIYIFLCPRTVLHMTPYTGSEIKKKKIRRDQI